MTDTYIHGARCQNKKPSDLDDTQLEAEIKQVSAVNVIMYTAMADDRNPNLGGYSIHTSLNLKPLLEELEKRVDTASGPQRPDNTLLALQKVVLGAKLHDGVRDDYNIAEAVLNKQGYSQHAIGDGMKPMFG